MLRVDSKEEFRALKPAFNALDWIAIKREFRRGFIDAYRDNQLTVAIREEKQHFVVVGAAGSGLRKAIPKIVKLAKNRGYTKIRFHNRHGKTPRAINAKLIDRRKNEYVYLLEI